MSLSRVVEVARGELGVTEDPPGSNIVKYWDEYDPAFQGQPWCVAFLWWCFRQAGESEAFFGGGRTASCTVLRRWYREKECIVSAGEVRAGDIVILNFSGTKESQHCGLVTKASPGGEVTTVEGNTSGGSGSQAGGGMVCQKTRYPSQIVAVCRPQYREEDVETGFGFSAAGGPHPPAGEAKDDAVGHWAEDAIRRCVDRGLLRGYPDGSFRPDQSVTRAELAVILQRLEESK